MTNRQGPFLSPKVRANDRPLLQRGARASRPHILLFLDSYRLASCTDAARSADALKKDDLTANECEWTRIEEIMDAQIGRDLCPKGPRE
jgi:hypothetical protein